MRPGTLLLLAWVAWTAGCAGAPPARGPAAPSGPGSGPERPAATPLGEGSRPRGAEEHVAKARQALAARNYRRAAEEARAVAAADPGSGEATRLEALAREAMGDLAGALPLWQEAAERPDADGESLAAYARLAVRRGEGPRALAALEARLGREPPGPGASELRGLAGWVALSLGRVAEARRHLEELGEGEARDRYAVALGRTRLLTGDPAGAAAAAERARAAGDAAAAWELLGDARQAQGLAAGAEQAYREALARAPDAYAALVNLGVLRLSQGDPTGAEELFVRATAAQPGEPEGWNDLGLARRARGDLAGARDAYERALALTPRYPPALKNLGVLNEKYLGRPAAALPYYERYLEARPEDEEVARWRKAAERLAAEGGT